MIEDTKTEETTNAETEETVTEVTESAASLTVQDLSNLRNIIDVASKRGAFKTTEFTVVGATYTKLNNFIDAITPAEEVQTGDAATETETSADASGDE